MASNSTPSPPHLSTQELKNAAAGVVSERASLPRPLRSSQSFRLDEGYSGEETPIVYDEASGQDLRAVREGVDFRIPPWMAGLNDALREEYAYKLIRTLPTSRIASLVDRLVPILYLDFVQMLPPELSLQILSYLPVRSLLNASLASRTWRRFALEPRLWKDLYEVQGWRSNDAEILRLENKLREGPGGDVRQQTEVKRKAEDQKDEEKNLRDIARRNSERSRNSAERSGVERSSGSNSPAAMDTAQEWPSQTTTGTEVDINNITQDTEGLDMSFYSNASHNAGLRPGQGASFASDSAVPDNEEIFSTYPGAPGPSIPQATYQEPPLPIEPTLTVPGYGSSRVNWGFLFKYRKRLEDNWIHNRYSTFQIPHPDFPTEGHAECVYTIQYSPNYLVSGSRDRTVRIWDMETRRLRGEPLKGHAGSVLCLQFDESPDEDVLITGSSDDSVIIWKFSTGKIIRTIEKAHQESVLNLKFSKKWLVTCSKDKLIKVWNRQQLETTDQDYPWDSKLLFGGQEVQAHPHHPRRRRAQATRVVQDPATSSGSGLRNPYASSGFVGTGAPSWGPAKTLLPYTPVQVLIGHSAAVNAIQLYGDQIASASGDRLIKLWNLKAGTCEKTYVGHTKGIACIQFDGHTIVSGSSDQTIRVFDGRTQAETATLSGHRALVRTVQATENRIVSGSYDETVRIWRKDVDGQWTDSHVLRQGGPETHHPRPIHHAMHPMMPGNLQQGTMPQAPIPQAAVQMHQVHTVGPGLAGAVAAAQLLPNHHHHHHQPQPQPPPPPPPPQAQAQQQQMPLAHPMPTASGTHRVFKLQFDARWIICCSQDSKIIGWDYAAGDEGIIEASRFFKGGN